MEEKGLRLASASMLDFCGDVLQLGLPEGDADQLRAILDECFAPSDLLIADHEPTIPRVFVSDMDSTMITAECIDELADFAGIKHHIAAITERAMQGELDFESALRERVLLLRDLSEDAILECLGTRISPMPGAQALVATLKAKGCRTVLVTGGFHQFADPVAEMLGFARVVGNRLAVSGGKLTGWYAAGLQIGFLAGTVFVAWLMVQSLVVIQALCSYCMAAWAATFATLWYVTLANLSRGRDRLPAQIAAASAVAHRHHSAILDSHPVVQLISFSKPPQD